MRAQCCIRVQLIGVSVARKVCDLLTQTNSNVLRKRTPRRSIVDACKATKDRAALSSSLSDYFRSPIQIEQTPTARPWQADGLF
jgi:hypothetical protein